MPELPEVETTLRGIGPHIQGKRVQRCIIRNPNLRWPISPTLTQAVEGQRLNQLSRRGKYLILSFAQGHALWHLGMSGSLRIVPASKPPATHDHVDWVFGPKIVLRYHDPRRFGALLWTEDPVACHPLIQHLGPEPLGADFNGDYLYQKSRKRSQAVKTFIMDAKVVVGVGNIYANEALFLSGIHPFKACGKLSKPQYQRLADTITQVLQFAITRGGTTLRDFVGGDGKPGYFAQELFVYGRGSKPCKQCGKALTEKVLAQRATVYCTQCQR